MDDVGLPDTSGPIAQGLLPRPNRDQGAKTPWRSLEDGKNPNISLTLTGNVLQTRGGGLFYIDGQTRLRIMRRDIFGGHL